MIEGQFIINIAVVEALGENVEDFVINRPSIQRSRQIFCKERAILIKNNPHKRDLQAVVLYWDG